MGLVRQAWMAAMPKRGDRVIDAILIGHIHSVTFFASTTMLVAALVGTLAAVLAGVLATVAVLQSAHHIAAGAPYCIEIAGGTGQYRAVRTLFDLSVFLYSRCVRRKMMTG